MADSEQAGTNDSEDTKTDSAVEDEFTPMIEETLGDDKTVAKSAFDSTSSSSPDKPVDEVVNMAPGTQSMDDNILTTSPPSPPTSSTSLVIEIEDTNANSDTLVDCGIEVKAERLEEYVNAQQDHDARTSTSTSLESVDVQSPSAQAEEVESLTIGAELQPPISVPLAHLDVDMDIDEDRNLLKESDSGRGASIPTSASRTASTESTTVMSPTQQSTISTSEESGEYGGEDSSESIPGSSGQSTTSIYIEEQTEEIQR